MDVEAKQQNISPEENLNGFESEGKSEGIQIVQSSNRARFKIGDQLEVTAESRRGEGTFRSRNWVAPPSKGVGRVIKVNWEENGDLEPSYTYDIKYPVEGINRGVEEGTLAIHNPDENKARKSKGRCREVGCGCLVVDCGHLQPGERGYISPEEREVYIYISPYIFMHTYTLRSIYMYIYIHMYTYMYIYICIYIYIHIYIYIYMNIYRHKQSRKCVFVYMYSIYSYVYVDIYIFN
jgi:hypothetical protein